MKHVLALSLLLSAFPAACDPDTQTDQAEDVAPRDAQFAAAKAESIDHAQKLIASCLAYNWEPVSLQFTAYDPNVDGLQGYVLTIESNAPVAEVSCVMDIITSWSEQP